MGSPSSIIGWLSTLTPLERAVAFKTFDALKEARFLIPSSEYFKRKLQSKALAEKRKERRWTIRDEVNL